MTGSKTQIDYILINKKWKNSVKNVEAYSSFSSLGSDHRIVTARLKLSLRTSKTLSREKQYDWKVLRSDSEIQSQYTILVRNRFEELYSDSQTATEKYQHLIDANGKAADKLIPEKKRKKKTQSSKDVRIKEKREEVNKAFSEYKQTPTSENQERLQIAKTLLQETYEGVEAEELESMIQQVERADARSSHSESWKLINEISGRKNGEKGRLKGDSKESRIQSWYTHFSQLLGKEPEITDVDEIIDPVLEHLEIKTGPFTMDEYKKVKKKITEGKAFGSDKLPHEVLKRCDLDDIILQFANDLLLKSEKPQQWSDLDLITLPKKGDLGCTANIVV